MTKEEYAAALNVELASVVALKKSPERVDAVKAEIKRVTGKEPANA